nr:amylase A-180 - alkaliphilic eubacterium 163-26 [alkaliphilic eubacterium 163-26]CAA37453.1 precursor polypeptide (AA -37 to 1647) [uncultured bacterium]
MKQQLNRVISIVLCLIVMLSVFESTIMLLPGSVEVKGQEYRELNQLENKPFSWDNANVYFVLTDRFYNGNTSNDNSYGRPQIDAWGTNIGTFHGGDIKGLTKKLEEGYFTDLGTNAIWISAPWEQMHGWVGGKDGDFAHYGYHGYYGLDFTAMDQNMGTIDEMREFVDLAHSLGIRVVLDIVMNHVGYPTIVDMHEFGFGDTGGLPRDWTPNQAQGQNWHTHNDIMNKDNEAAWANWWGSDWIRADETAGYDNCGGSEQTMCIGFLPDIKTEVTTGVDLPPILRNKWNDQASGYEDWFVPAAEPYRQDLNIAPKDYLIKWITSWVEEFGIDGFRVDTAKHVEIERWAELKNEAEVALQTWRENNPDKPGANWDDNFWMTAEVFGHGLGKSEYFDFGFDSVINFEFQNANFNNLEGLFSRYANSINTDPDFNMLSYVSSHDTKLYSRDDLIQAGTALLLLPGGVQVFYGDETARPLGDGGSDPEQGTRSSMNWANINQNVLSHWQKLGQFRNNHIAIGAGAHQKLSDSPYTFARTYESDDIVDEVVVATGAQGTTAVTVEGVFEDGTVVRDAYTGDETTVTKGTATFTAGTQGIILIENTAEPVTNLPIVSATPGNSSFRTDDITITLNVDRADMGKYTLDGSDPADGLTFMDGEEIVIGADMEFDETATLRLYAENENGIRTRSYTYRKVDPDALLEVYFKKPADWGTPHIYYYDTFPEEPEVTWTTAPEMTLVEDDWYVYVFENAESANIIFKDSSGKQIPGPNEPGFFIDQIGWYDGVKWLDSDPFEREPKEPATTPKNLSVVNVTETTVTFEWDQSDGYVVEYEILRDEDVVASTIRTTFTDEDLNPDTTYTYSVVAVGEGGQKSAPSEALKVTTLEENDEPKEPAEAPENLRIADITDTTVTINWNASNGYVTGYEVLRDGVVIGETTRTTFIDTGLDADRTYTYTIVALGDGGQKSDPSEALEVTTQEKPEGNLVTIYYKKGFDTPYMHYRPEGGEWTIVPGIRMEESEIAGYSKLTVDIREASKLEVAFNNGRGAWDSDQENNYLFEPGVHTYIPSHEGRGEIIPGKPGAPIDGNKVTIYYQNGFDTPYVHYRPEGGNWTNAPGLKMEDSEFASYSRLTLDIGEANRAEVAFNNGRGLWDSDNENNYFFNIGDNTYIPGKNGSAGEIYGGKPRPPLVGNEVIIYYKNGFDTPYVHYRPEGGTWTNAPGIKMDKSEIAGYSKITLDIGRADRVEVAFNDGRGAWDSDNERNYLFVVGNNTYEPGINGAPGQVKHGVLPDDGEDPGDIEDPDHTSPSKPTDLTAIATAHTVSLSWTASADDVEVAGYKIYRDGVEIGVTESTTYTDSGLTAETTYSYMVQAYDTSNNFSALSDELTIETAEKTGVDPGGDMPYSTNPSFGKKVTTPITIDGVNDGEWTDDMLIAIGMAGDDPRSLGDNWSMHETPMDLTHLWGAWDHEYLYLAWQYVDVTDIIDPANAGSSAGTTISQMDMPQTIAIDTIPEQGATHDMWGKNGGESLWGGPDLPDYQLNIASNMFHSGYISRAVDGVFPVDDGGINYKTGEEAGITVKFSKGKGYSTLWGVLDADDAVDPSKLVNFTELAHDSTRDTFYEAKIPLAAIGNPDIENERIGVMIHQGEFSPMDTLPNDPATSDTPGVSESNSPLEWEDIDLLTVPFARIGQ